ncbi:hypothetical protein BGLA2_2860011 [Burkholderia gladioli]|nr:hypothetical protein BGLA2_2860011 [Burkholderia gladioli]
MNGMNAPARPGRLARPARCRPLSRDDAPRRRARARLLSTEPGDSA